MSVNDTILCTLAKKLHNINPSVVIDDPAKVEELLQNWWDGIVNDKYHMPEDMTILQNTALTDWLRSMFAKEKEVIK